MRLRGHKRYALRLDPVGAAAMRAEAGEDRQCHDGCKADKKEPVLVAKAGRQCLASSLSLPAIVALPPLLAA